MCSFYFILLFICLLLLLLIVKYQYFIINDDIILYYFYYFIFVKYPIHIFAIEIIVNVCVIIFINQPLKHNQMPY